MGPEIREDTVLRIPDSDGSRRSEPILNFRLINSVTLAGSEMYKNLRGGKMGAISWRTNIGEKLPPTYAHLSTRVKVLFFNTISASMKTKRLNYPTLNKLKFPPSSRSETYFTRTPIPGLGS